MTNLGITFDYLLVFDPLKHVRRPQHARAAKDVFFLKKNLFKNTLVLNTKMYFFSKTNLCNENIYFFQKQTYATKSIFSKFLRKMKVFSQFQFLKSSWMVLKILSDPALDGQRVSRSSAHGTSA